MSIRCPICGKPNTINHVCTPPIVSAQYCSICGEVYTEGHRCLPRPVLRCSICGEVYTEGHRCLPRPVPTCPICGKPNTINHVCTPTFASAQYCSRCGEVLVGGQKHICSYKLCPICRKVYDAREGHDCLGLPVPKCPRCGEVYTEGHVCTLCPNCRKYHSSNVLCKRTCPICGATIIGNLLHICPNKPRYISCPICRKVYDAREGHDCLGLPVPKCPRCGGPLGRCGCWVQRVIPEVSIGKFLEDGWTFKVQLQSGNVIMEKAVDVENITNTVMEQARKQIENTVTQANKQVTEATTQADVANITDKVLEQANKKVTEAIALERQKLLKE